MNKNTSPVARLVWTVVSYGLFGLVFLAVLYPLFWMLITSLKDQAQIFSNPYGLPNPPTLDNYIETWTRGNFGTYFWNSLLITVPSLAGVLIVSSLAGYAFARFRFAGSRALFLYLLIGVMVPPQAIMISAFLVTARLDLIDTRWALIAT